jgi:hypothetical protein
MADQSKQRMNATRKTLIDSDVKYLTQQKELNAKFLTHPHLQPPQEVPVGFKKG